MANYELIRNVLRIHELIAESQPGVQLTSNDIALLLKVRIVSPLRLSEKQIASGMKFLRNLGYPLEYHERERRWFYNWSTEFLHPTPIETFNSSRGPFPRPTFAMLMMLRHGLDILVGTPMWGDVREFFESLLENELWKQTRDMGDMFSIRPREGSGMAEGVFQCVAEAVYERSQIEITLNAEAGSEEEVLRVEPYHLTLSEGLWHVVAGDYSEKPVLRTFAMARIGKAERTGKVFSAPEPLWVKRYLRNTFGEVVPIDEKKPVA